jgi:hypothetical protein
MKSSILLIVCSTTVAALTSKAQSTANPGNAVAQTNRPPVQVPRAAPTQRAVHMLEVLQERLELNPDQVQNINSVYLEENIALDSLADHPSSDPKADNLARRDIYHNADVRVYSYLNELQQLQYVMWKQEQRIKNLEKRNQINQTLIDSLTRQQQPQIH